MKPNPPREPTTKKTLAYIFGGCYALALLLFVGELAYVSALISDPVTNYPASTTIARIFLGIGICFGILGSAAGPFVFLWRRNQGVPVNIPENNVAVLFIEGRKQLVVQGKSFNIQPDKSQELQFFSLREQSRPIQHTCDTADQLRVNLDIEMRWQHVAANMMLYLDSIDDPPAAVERIIKSELTSQINKNDYKAAMQSLKVIGARVTRTAQIKAAQYGLQVNSVNINSAKIDAATSAAREEAQRINALNDAVNKASDKTLDYVLKSKDDKKDDKK